MGDFTKDGIVKDFEAADVVIAPAGTVTQAAEPLDPEHMDGVAVSVLNTGANPLTATVSEFDGGVAKTTPAPLSGVVAAGGLGFFYLPIQAGCPVSDSVQVSCTSAAGTTFKTRVRAKRRR